MLCLVVEFPGEGDFPPFTRTNPGATVDLMAEPSQGDHHKTTCLVLVRNAPWPAIEGLVADLGRRRAPLSALRSDPAEPMWFGRATYDSATFTAPSAKAIASLLGLIGPPWVHVEAGVVHLRARLRDPTQAEDVLHLAVEGLRAAGAEAQVVVQEIAPKDHSVWESLIRHGIGLSL